MIWMEWAGAVSASSLGATPGSPGILVDAAVRALGMAMVVGVGLWAARTTNVMAQKVAWGLVLAGALLMPAAAPLATGFSWAPVARIRIPLQAAGAKAAVTTNRVDTPAPSFVIPATDTEKQAVAERPAGTESSQKMEVPDGVGADRFPSPAIASGGSSTEVSSGAHTRIPTGKLITAREALWLVYLTVTGLLLVRFCYGAGAAIGLWQSAEPLALDEAEGFEVRVSRKVSSPVTVGSGIVLPADYDEWNAEKLRIVLAHEKSHVKQRDFYLQMLAGLYAALFWFSPLGWWLKRKLTDLSEAISDRAGMDEAGSPAGYARVLLEFAARPHTIQTGVAMASRGSVAHRIERLLNENLFRQAFAGGRGRLIAAALLAPFTLCAVALVRVEAAGQAPAAPPAAQAPATPAAPPAPAAPTAAVVPDGVTDEPAEAPEEPEITPDLDEHQDGPPPLPPLPAVPRVTVHTMVHPSINVKVDPQISLSKVGSDLDIVTDDGQGNVKSWGSGHGRNYAYSYQTDGDSYAVIRGGDKQIMTFTGGWPNAHKEELEKAKQAVHGDFLWFERGGKSYVVDDPSVLERIEGLYRPMEDLERQQKELGREQEALGKLQSDMSEGFGDIRIPKADLTKELANLSSEIAKIQAMKEVELTQKQLEGIQEKLAGLQERLGSMEGDFGAKAGELGRKQGELGRKQGELGAKQGHLGAEQGRIARDADREVKSIIDESLKNGKARPVN